MVQWCAPKACRLCFAHRQTLTIPYMRSISISCNGCSCVHSRGRFPSPRLGFRTGGSIRSDIFSLVWRGRRAGASVHVIGVLSVCGDRARGACELRPGRGKAGRHPRRGRQQQGWCLAGVVVDLCEKYFFLCVVVTLERNLGSSIGLAREDTRGVAQSI